MTGRRKTFVLLHGAWHGGWCWERVAKPLRTRGHRVTTPTQTGLGERSHLLTAETDIEVFITDLVNHMLWEDLDDVILVGHSFAGNAITGAAERIPERIRQLVYLDALIPQSGRSPFDELPASVVADRIALAQRTSGGLSIPAPSAADFGVNDPEDAAWLQAHLTPHPLQTFLSSQIFDGAPGNGIPAEYILCSDPVYGPLDSARRRARSLGWPVTEIATGHDAMVTAAPALVDHLDPR